MLRSSRWKSFLVVIGSAALLLLFMEIRDGALDRNLWADPVTYVVLFAVPAIVIANIYSMARAGAVDDDLSLWVAQMIADRPLTGNSDAFGSSASNCAQPVQHSGDFGEGLKAWGEADVGELGSCFDLDGIDF